VLHQQLVHGEAAGKECALCVKLPVSGGPLVVQGMLSNLAVQIGAMPIQEHFMLVLIIQARAMASSMVRDTVTSFPDFFDLCSAVIKVPNSQDSVSFVLDGQEGIRRMMEEDPDTITLALKNIFFMGIMHTVLAERFEAIKRMASPEDNIELYSRVLDTLKKYNNISNRLVSYWGFSTAEL
jgi:hypothetical protein